MKSLFSITLACLFIGACGQATGDTVTLTKDELLNKIKGGWAGQTIGCTYGGPTEFRYCSQMISSDIDIPWPDGYITSYFDNAPGLYDDLYMDLTFVDVFAKKGLDAPVSEFADAFANAEYMLWHANQQARYNIQNGIEAPQSGYWEQNPHADDIDFQIEADYAGLMAPGMINAAVHYTDDIGHIMNYGDGWYGGVYVAAMYSLAFICDDIETIVEDALNVIPAQSRYYKCMKDVISWHKQYPDDWKITWDLCEKNYSFDIGCPDGVFQPFDIDAVINSAYILIGLLYGGGNFSETIDIATRCGKDSDCNPASAAGILGTMIGYDNIPEYWKKNLYEVENRPFAYTDISLNKAYQLSYNQALEVIRLNGGKINADNVKIKVQKPVVVRFEQSFTGHYPVSNERMGININEVINFTGNGVVVGYHMNGKEGRRSDIGDKEYVAEVAVSLDGQLVETVKLPVLYMKRKNELVYKYNLIDTDHSLSFEWLNPREDVKIVLTNVLVYSGTNPN